MAFEILARLGLNSTGFNAGMKRAESSAVAFSRSLNRHLAGAFTIGAMVQFTRSTIAAGSAIQDTSDRLGISTKRVQELAFAAKQTGSDINGVNIAYGELGKTVEAAKLSPGGKDAAGLAVFGLNANDLQSLNLDQIFDRIAGRMKGVTNGSREMAVASEVFGKGWRGILPLLVQGFDSLAAAAPVMRDETVKALDDIGDALDRFKSQSVSNFAPALVQGLEWLSIVANQAHKDIVRVSTYAGTVAGLAGARNADGSEMTGMQVHEAAVAAVKKEIDAIEWKSIRAKIDAEERNLIGRGQGLEPEGAAGAARAPSPSAVKEFSPSINALQRIGAEIVGGAGADLQRRQLDVQMKMEKHLNDIKNKQDTGY